MTGEKTSELQGAEDSLGEAFSFFRVHLVSHFETGGVQSGTRSVTPVKKTNEAGERSSREQEAFMTYSPPGQP